MAKIKFELMIVSRVQYLRNCHQNKQTGIKKYYEFQYCFNIID